MKKSWLAGLMATALTVSMLAGCSSGSSGTTKATETKDTKASAETTAETAAAAGDSDTILIGVSASITGSAPTNGLRTQQGAQLAVDEINAAGGVLGKQLELYVADDGGTQDTGINATNLIASQNVVAQVGPNLSGLALAVEGIVSEAGYPMLVGATSPKLVTTINNEWLFRIRASDSIPVSYTHLTLPTKRIV